VLCPRADAVTTSTTIPPGIAYTETIVSSPSAADHSTWGGPLLPCRRATLAACRPSSWCGKVFRLFGLRGAATK
jgi:hypothetical protein